MCLAQTKFDQIATQYLDQSPKWNPILASWQGFEGFDDKLNPIDAASQMEHVRFLERYIETVSYTHLTLPTKRIV